MSYCKPVLSSEARTRLVNGALSDWPMTTSRLAERDSYAAKNAPVISSVIEEIRFALTCAASDLGAMASAADFAAMQAAIVAALNDGAAAINAASPREA